MLRVYLALPKIRILTCFGVFLTSVGFLLYGAHSIPDNLLSDIQYYNGSVKF